MKFFIYLSVLSFVFVINAANAQSDLTAPTDQVAATKTQKNASSTDEPEIDKGPKVEVIRHSDSGSTIEEVRVAGEVQSITVKPTGNMPSYSITPEQHNMPKNTGTGGKRVWKLISF